MKITKYDIFSFLVIASLAGCTAFSVIKEPRLMSEKENRELATFPEVTVKGIFDGTFMDEFEQYASDQFAFRDIAVSIKADSERLLGKKGNNGVHFGKDGYLIGRPDPCNIENIGKSINALSNLQKKGKFNMTVALVPTAFEIMKDKLPSYAYNSTILDIQSAAAEYAKGTGVKVFDVTTELEKHNDEYIYYRTDHHQTALGSYYTYKSLGEALGYEPYTLSSFKRSKVSTDFLGTSWSKSSISFVEPDIIETFALSGDVKVNTSFPLENKSFEGMYVMDNANKKDKYTVYLDGNHALTVLESNQQTGRELLVFKDSYAHSIAPFLANHYDKIHLIDMRYFNADPVEYIGENNITDILVLYSADTFSSDTNLGKLGDILETTDYYLKPPYGVLDEQPSVPDEYFADAVMFGDSLTYAHETFTSLPFKFVCKSAVNTQTVRTDIMSSGKTVLQELLSVPDVNKYYIMLGINEVSYRPLEEYKSNYAGIIDEIRAVNPDAIIYIQAVMPVERKVEARKIYQRQIDSGNEVLKELAVEKGCYYLATNEAIAEADGYLRNGAAEDGVHVGKSDHDKWDEYLKTHAVGKTGVSETTASVSIFAGSGKINYDEYAKQMLETVSFKDELSPLRENIIARLYGIEANEALGGIVYISGGATAEEFAIFEADSPEKAKAIGEKLKARVENRKPDFESYKPEEMAKLNDPVIVVKGNAAMLCISGDNEKAKSVMDRY